MGRKKLSLNSVIVRMMILVLAVAAPIAAQEEGVDPNRTFVYSAKYVCKDAGVPATDAGRAFTPAVYRTVVNLHNLHAEPVTVVFRAVEAHHVDNPVPGASGRIEKTIEPGQAVFIGCAKIQEILGDSPDNPDKIDGFVTVASRRRLDAAVVYTAVNRSPIDPNDGVTIDVERMRPKIVHRDGRVEEE